MKLLVFSDVHGNLPALEHLLRHAGQVDGYISLGDVVNYGPWSNECADLVASLPNIISLEGNHERYFLEGHYDGHNEVAKTFFEFCYPSFNRRDKITGLKKEYELGGFTFAHTIEDRYIYPDSEITLDKNYVVGHSHHQFVIEQPPFKLYNPGSAGQNRKYINVINYILLETEGMVFELRALTYDVDQVIQTMKDQGYPQLCVDYYEKKRRAA